MAQTRAVLDSVRHQPTASQAVAAAADLHARTGMTAGNGSLMRTAPVALAYLDDEAALWQAAQRISSLTHFDPEAGEACALWCLAIRSAIWHGTYDGLRAALELLPAVRKDIWAARLDEAETSQPWQFPKNGWVVHALQSSWSAVSTTPDHAFAPALHLFPAQSAAVAIERAVRAGHDTDTVAAIAGSLVGARWGMSALPLRWTSVVHGFHEVRAGRASGMRANALQHLSYQVAEHGTGALPESFKPAGTAPQALVTIPGVDGLLLGGHAEMADADLRGAGVVSLSRVGVNEAAEAARHASVFVLDQPAPDVNPHLHFSLLDVTRTIHEWRTQGPVVLHCVMAHNRTPTYAVAYLVTQCGWSLEPAVSAVREALPQAQLAEHLLGAVRDLPSTDGSQPALLENRAELLWSRERGTALYAVTPGRTLRRHNGVWCDSDEPTDGLEPASWDAVAEFDEMQRSRGVIR